MNWTDRIILEFPLAHATMDLMKSRTRYFVVELFIGLENVSLMMKASVPNETNRTFIRPMAQSAFHVRIL